MKKIGIIGCGWLGLHLANHFSTDYKIYTTTTAEQKAKQLKSQNFNPTIIKFSDENSPFNSPHWEVLQELEAIIITIPFGKKMDIQRLENRFENIKNFIGNFQKSLFLMSSTSIYPDIETEITENTFAENELNPNIFAIEHKMKKEFPQINILRLGGLMGGSRQLKNYSVKDLEKPVNHIHYEDICKIVEIMLQKNIQSKIYNVVAPLHPSKLEVITGKIHTDNICPPKKSRIILSDVMTKDLKYHFLHPNPIFF